VSPGSERGSSAAAAAERVRAVLEAAEQSAAELRAEAAREIETQLQRAEKVTERLSARAEQIERALESLATTVTGELNALRADLEELRAVSESADEESADSPAPEPVTKVKPPVEEPEAAPEEPEPTEPDPAQAAEAEEPAEPAHSPSAPPAPAGDGHEGARVIALNMALNGSSREETARYLSENFELEDPEALLDEVYARVD
jgi:hypothetical protein